MKVLLTTPTFPPFNSGLGNAVQMQARALSDRGHSVTVVTGGATRSSEIDTGSGARVERFTISGSYSPVHPVRGDVTAYRRFLAAGEFDVAVFNAWQTWSTDIPLGMLDRIGGRKYVYSHGLSTDLKIPYQPVRSLMRWLSWRPYRFRLAGWMRALDGLIFLAPGGCDCRFDDLSLARALGVPFAVVPNAMSAAAARRRMEPQPRERRRGLVAIGAYEPLKGHDFVLRAYAASNACNQIPLDFFGQQFGAYSDQLRGLAASLGLDLDLVRFHQGYSGEALIERCATAFALLSGSHTECQPLILLDTLAVATPFVARARGCIPALPGGLAIEREDEMAAAIDRLLCNNSAWCELAEAGRDGAAAYEPEVVGTMFNRVVMSG